MVVSSFLSVCLVKISQLPLDERFSLWFSLSIAENVVSPGNFSGHSTQERWEPLVKSLSFRYSFAE